MVDFGYPIGPFATADLSSLDIGYDSRQRRAAQDPNYRKMPIAGMIVEMADWSRRRGWLVPLREGRQHSRTPIPNSRRRSAKRRPSSASHSAALPDEEILRRLLFASVDEACKILDEGKAYRASDIDVMRLNGFGFPRYRGRLVYWAHTIGVAEVYRQIQAWHQQ